jgi:hypothetical protein
MAAPDKDEFRKAMLKEVESHIYNRQWDLVKRSNLPAAGTEVLPAVWAFCCKRRIAMQEVYKWKARLNLHSGWQTKNVNYWDRDLLTSGGLGDLGREFRIDSGAPPGVAPERNMEFRRIPPEFWGRDSFNSHWSASVHSNPTK